MSYIRRLAVLLAFLVLAPPVHAQDVPDLFGPAGPGEASSAPPGQGVKRQRVARLNLRALERAVAPRGVDQAPGRVKQAARLESRLRLETFPGVAKTFRRKALEEAVGGGFVWIGDGEQGGGAATLVVVKDQVTGHVEIGGRTFRIEPQSGTLHRIIEVDIEALPPDAPHQHAPDSGAAPATSEQSSSTLTAPTVSAATTSTTTINLLVGYTDRANNAPSNIGSDINLSVSLANQAYVNSKVPVRLNLVGTMLVTRYDENAFPYTATLYNLTNVSGEGSTTAGRAAFAGLRTKRDSVRADLVALLREGGSYCGQAWVLLKPARSDAPYGYAQFSRGCISSHVLAHELGHNMGLNHDRYVETAASTALYNFGFVNLTKKVRDIMSYPNLCSATGASCALQNIFSNPRLYVGGMPFGIAQYKTGAADNARRLGETRTGVASFR